MTDRTREVEMGESLSAPLLNTVPHVGEKPFLMFIRAAGPVAPGVSLVMNGSTR